jgi:hypothetical protein
MKAWKIRRARKKLAKWNDYIVSEITAAHTADPSVPVRTRAEESDLTTDRLNWVLGATIGVKLAFPFGPPS